ncbi:MAG: hypothetical protein A2521_05020 [Deltaproteobacteria bacterium RIFOXYD12_FULL_57_12]|nr:MAG: hypothetical protein A2521_05020 [Deltaproteobacteria bacterium RIFOXYD12_FULL_57_12]
MHRFVVFTAIFCLSLLLAARGARGFQGGNPGAADAGEMEKHINKMKQENPMQYQRLMATAILPITDCASCHVAARRGAGTPGEAARRSGK